MTKLILTKTHEPQMNLAAEEYIFSQTDLSAVMLWQNENAIIIGRNQNTFSEINAEEVKNRSVSVVRRITGGGAVYHDLGNINYSVIDNEKDGDALNFKKFAAPIVEILAEIGIKAEFSGRNDLLIDGKKFSGNAQHIANGRILHHGTIMFSSDIDAVESLLTVNEEKIKSKAIKSVRSRVTTVKEHLPNGVNITVDGFFDMLVSHFGKSCEMYELTDSDKEKIKAIADEKYRTWEWNYGQSPKYSFKKTQYTSAGTVEVHLDTEDGLIKNAVIYGDFFALRPITEFTDGLIGLKHDEKALLEYFSSVPLTEYFAGITQSELIKCFI